MAGINRTTGKATDLITFSRASEGTALRKISYGSELVTNGTFDTGDLTGWIKVGEDATHTVTYSNGGARYQSDTTSPALYFRQNGILETGKLYRFEIETTTLTSGSLKIDNLEGGTINVTPAVGTTVFFGIPTSNDLVMYRNTSNVDVTIDNISVKEVLFDQPDGTLTLFNHPTNIPRIEYDAAGNVKGLLIEEARTNLVTYSEPSASGFNVVRSSLATSAVASPDGGFAQKLVEDTSAGVSHSLGTSGLATSTTYTLSWFAKAAERSFLALNIYSGTTSYWTWFDLSNGTVGTATNSPDTFVEDCGGGWYRCGITVTTAATGTPNTATYIAPSNGVLNYDGDGTSGIYIYGAQLEEGSFPTSYIPTSGATVTRAADIASISVDNFGYNQKAGTVVVDAISSVSNDENRLAVLTESSSNLRVVDLYRLSNALRMYDGTTVMGGGNITAPYELKVAGVYKSGNYALVVDGAVVSTTSNILVNSANTLKIGTNVYSARQLNGHIKSIAYYPRRLSNAQLQELTA